VTRVEPQQLAFPKAVDALAEGREAAGRRRASDEPHGGEWQRHEAEQHVDKVGARIGEQNAVPRLVHGELDLDAAVGHGFTAAPGNLSKAYCCKMRRPTACSPGTYILAVLISDWKN